jgi:hypothetical protein
MVALAALAVVTLYAESLRAISDSVGVGGRASSSKQLARAVSVLPRSGVPLAISDFLMNSYRMRLLDSAIESG